MLTGNGSKLIYKYFQFLDCNRERSTDSRFCTLRKYRNQYKSRHLDNIKTLEIWDEALLCTTGMR